MIKCFPKRKLAKSLSLCFPPLVPDPVNVKPVEKLLVSAFRTILNLPTVGLQKLVEAVEKKLADLAHTALPRQLVSYLKFAVSALLPTVCLMDIILLTENASTAADRNYSPTLSPPILKQNSSALSASFIYICIVR